MNVIMYMCYNEVICFCFGDLILLENRNQNASTKDTGPGPWPICFIVNCSTVQHHETSGQVSSSQIRFCEKFVHFETDPIYSAEFVDKLLKD